jgi:hypothetical protein
MKSMMIKQKPFTRHRSLVHIAWVDDVTICAMKMKTCSFIDMNIAFKLQTSCIFVTQIKVLKKFKN